MGGEMFWLWTFAYALVWLALMLAYGPLADRIATRIAATPPTLRAFRAIQQSRAKLIAGIVVAWILGGFLEELVFRGIVLKSVELLAWDRVAGPTGIVIAICVAAAGAGVIHLYQGPRAAIIITQLSVLFGVLFVISGYNLWAVMLCHGMYDTIAFIRFANKKSKYSKLDSDRGTVARA
jgi:membrane protease YdiL (CAAX protease family)